MQIMMRRSMAKKKLRSLPSGDLESRCFKIVPVDSRCKRGRWACWDYYDNEEPKRSKETLENRPSINVHKSQDSSTATSDTSRGALKCSSVTFAIESSDEKSDMENDPPEKSVSFCAQ
ncbi:hypothetical protein AB6A40_011639 [Gnathostoma spinigerum]|uniref:Uncharacterized protein n=1 Tax=Gnathostoma spinigerum TaxID=75299 RepID=A0ABD6F4W1_9BILA